MENGMHMAPTLPLPREGHHTVFLPPAPQGTPWGTEREEEEEEEGGAEEKRGDVGKVYAIKGEGSPPKLPPLTHTAPEAQTAERMP